MIYAFLNILFLAVIFTCLAVFTQIRPTKVVLVSLGVLLLLTALFDSLLVGLDIVSYDTSKILGVRIGHAPIEDFAYTFATVFIVVSLWSGMNDTKYSGASALQTNLRRLFVSSRPVSWVNTAFPFVAAYLATGGTVDWYFWLAAFYFLIPYNILIYVVNDVFDYESDVRNPRKNSIEGGLLPPTVHRFMLATTLVINGVFIVPLLFRGAVGVNLLFLFTIFTAVSYSVPLLRLKERPFLDSVNSSLHFVLPMVVAFVLTGWQSVYWLFTLAFFCWGVASHAFGAVQDIKADREANIASIATFLGASRTVRFSMIGYGLSVLITLICPWPGPIVAVPLLLYLFMVCPYINLADGRCEVANHGWRRFLLYNQLTGFVVTILLLWQFAL